MITVKPLRYLHRTLPGLRMLGWVAALLALPASAMAADDSAEKRYALPERGFVQLKVPPGWADLTNDGQDGVVNTALEMLKGAVEVPR